MTQQLSQNRWFTVILGVIITLTLTTYPSDPLKAQTTASVVAKMMKTVEDDVNLAQSKQVNLLSPSEFQKAFQNFEEAREADARGKNQTDIIEKLKKAQEHLTKAFNNAKIGATIFTDLLEVREAALDANAPQYAPDLFERAEKIFEGAAKKVEDGNTRAATEKKAEAIDVYQDAELLAIKESIIGNVHSLLEQAKNAKSPKYAPVSFLKSQTLLQESENILNSDRSKQSLAREKAQEAEYEALHSIYLARLAQDNRAEDTNWERLILEHEDLIRNIANELDLKDIQFDNGLSQSVVKINQVIRSLKENIKNLQAELQTRNQELAEQENKVKELRNQLSNSQQAELELKDKLEANKRREAKLKRVENLFGAEEAKVLRESNNLKIRLVGLNFRPGKAEIDAEFFSLLTKVQQAIREFPQAKIFIEGHTDSKGSAAKNLRLSTSRAEAVKSYLMANMGLPDSQVNAVGFGAARPIAPNDTEDGRRQNRRIDLVIDISNAFE